MTMTYCGCRFGMFALIFGCAAAPVHVIGGTNDAYKCGPNQGALLARNGRVAVCMSEGVAEFTTCAMALAAGNDESTADSEIGSEISVPGIANGKVTQKDHKTQSYRESAADAVLRSRARALDACRMILISYGLKEASDSEAKAIDSKETKPEGLAPGTPSHTGDGR